jgi:hypothetical protein
MNVEELLKKRDRLQSQLHTYQKALQNIFPKQHPDVAYVAIGGHDLRPASDSIVALEIKQALVDEVERQTEALALVEAKVIAINELLADS